MSISLSQSSTCVMGSEGVQLLDGGGVGQERMMTLSMWDTGRKVQVCAFINLSLVIQQQCSGGSD